MSQETSPPSAPGPSPPDRFRVFEVAFGCLTVGISLFVIFNPGYGTEDLVFLLAAALAFISVRMIVGGGVRKRLRSLEAVGLAGAGLVALLVVISVLLAPGLSLDTLVVLLALALIVQGLGRLFYSVRRRTPAWPRQTAIATASLMVVIAIFVALVKGLALLTLVELLALTILISGAAEIVAGLGATSQKQTTLLKLVAFALFYGIIFVNWIDLFDGSAYYLGIVPGYHVWLIMAYLIPFGVLILVQGRKDWELAFSLGLLASLGNDLGYYVVGNAFFGFHVNLLDWYAHQLGLYGRNVLFTFDGGFFSFGVPSWLMGLAIYARVAIVILSLRHWWRRPW